MSGGPAGEPRHVELTLDGFTHGGAAVGRLPDGRACFVDHAIPGERVLVQVTEIRKRWARATLVEILDPSPDRVVPPCPLAAPGRCGGCSLQHIAVERQTQLLGEVIADQLRRIGHIEPPGTGVEVVSPHRADGLGYRNRARFAVAVDGRLGFRRARSREVQAIDDCPLLTDGARNALTGMATGWEHVTDVSLQTGIDGTAALAVTADSDAPTVPSALPAVIRVRGQDRPGGRPRRRRARGRDRVRHPRHDRPADATARVHQTVAGHTFVVSPTSFFQASVAAAEVLVDLVRRLTDVHAGEHVADLYAGIGLFSVVLADDGARVTAIESDAGACADARINAGGRPVEVVQADVTRPPTLRSAVDAVVLDPPRTGAGPHVITWIADLAATRVTYVSCDPATFARDARLLVDAGYHLERVVGVDQFTHTGHIELVGGFARAT